MGILQSPVTRLIIGILSYVVNNEQTSNFNELIGNLKRLAEQGQFPEAVVFNWQRAQFVQLSREICSSNGGLTAYDNAEKGLEKFENCVRSVFSTEMRAGRNDFDAVIKYYCPKVQPFHTCYEQFLNTFNPCLNIINREDNEQLLSSGRSLLDYACENGGVHIKTFINDNGVECIGTHQAGLMNCFNHFKKAYKNANSINTLMKHPFLGASVAECKHFREFEHCEVEEFKKCNKPSISNFGKSLVHIMFQESGCKKLLGSDASPTTAINFLLVIVTTAMLL